MVNALKAFLSGLSKKEKKILYIAAAVVSLAVLDWIIVTPLNKSARAYEDNISTHTELIKKRINILQRKEIIMAEDKAYGSFFTKEDSTREERMAKFVSEVENFGRLANIKIVNVQPMRIEEEDDFNYYLLTIECEGVMKNIGDFFYAVEKSTSPVRIISFQVSPKGRDDYEVRCVLTIVKMIITKREFIL